MSNATIETRESTKIKLKEPSKYKVLVLNDDFTPMDFVIVMLIEIFKHSDDKAIVLTKSIHEQGSAVAGIYTYEIAEQKSISATNLAREHGYPLVIKVEVE